MPAIFSKNCILVSELDLYCLACSVHLMSEDEALEHVQDLKHKEVINSIEYLATHEQDLIRKVAGIYFCEVCNIIISTLAKVKVHVTENAHLAGKRRGALNREGDAVVFAGDVFISESAWHALVEDTCMLCNVEGVDVTAHKCETSHVINLINNKVIFNANNDLYRKVDDIYQCITCNQVISERLLTEHLSSEEHKKRFTILKDFSGTLEQTKIRENAESQPNTPKKVSESESTEKSIPTVMEKKEQEMSASSIPKFLETFDKEHGLIMKTDNIVYCNLCNTQVPATIDTIKEHLDSRQHSDKEPGSSDSNKQNPAAIVKVKMDDFYQRIQVRRSDNGLYFVFCDSLCVNGDVFMGINRRSNKVSCRFCKMEITPEPIPLHVKSKKHDDFLLNSFLITSLEGELVREMKPDMYDCAYCGVLKSSYDAMLDHLATGEHKKCRAEHEKKLKTLTPPIVQGRTRNDRDLAYMNALMFENMFSFKNLNID